MFSAYAVISYSIFNFLPSLDFSFQNVVWFVFCLADLRLLLQLLSPVFSAISILRALCHFPQSDVTTELWQHTHVPSPRLWMDVGNKTGPRTKSYGFPPEKPSHIDRKPPITELREQFFKCCVHLLGCCLPLECTVVAYWENAVWDSVKSSSLSICIISAICTYLLEQLSCQRRRLSSVDMSLFMTNRFRLFFNNYHHLPGIYKLVV